MNKFVGISKITIFLNLIALINKVQICKVKKIEEI